MKRRSGSRIKTNGTISPRLTASPKPPNHSPASSTSGYLMGKGLASHSPRLTPTLPPIRETVTNKMPLNGKVPGYRQPSEIWIDGDLAKDRRRVSPLGSQNSSQGVTTTPSMLTSSSLNQIAGVANGGITSKPDVRRQYGYMDDFKASMITHWVENQKDREDKEGARFLTQFKQADSTSDSGEGSEQHTLDNKTKEVTASTKADINQPLVQAKKSTGKEPPLPPPRRSSSKEKEICSPNLHQEASESINNAVRQKLSNIEISVDSLQLPNSKTSELSPSGLEGNYIYGGMKLSPRGETEGSEASSVPPLPEPNFEQLFPSSLSGTDFFRHLLIIT